MENSPPFRAALGAFCKALPGLVTALRDVVAGAHAQSVPFTTAFDACLDGLLARFRTENAQPDRFGVFPPHIASWEPILSTAVLDDLIIQHLLLERLFRCAFPIALHYNTMARGLASVIAALEVSGFDRSGFLAALDASYLAVEHMVRSCLDRGEQQQVLSTFCEQFITAFDREQAEERSVIYTPQEIVQYMCRSVELQLQREFERSLSSPHVAILDPCTGIGSYLVYAMRCIGREMLPYKYQHELFGIEIMLLPYLIATLNIEQTFVGLVGWYVPFPGLRFANALS